jgi:hypothetical protein
VQTTNTSAVEPLLPLKQLEANDEISRRRDRLKRVEQAGVLLRWIKQTLAAEVPSVLEFVYKFNAALM